MRPVTRRPACAVLLVVASLLPLPAVRAQAQPAASPRRDVVAAVPRDWPPYYMEGGGGRPTGFAVDVMHLVARQAGLRVRYEVVPDFPAAIALLKAGEADLVPNMGIVTKRQPWLHFSPPVDVFAVSVFVRPTTRGIHGVEDLRERPFAVVESNVAEHLLDGWPDARVYGDVRTALYEVLAGQVDALVYPEPVVRHLLRQAGLEDRLRVVGPPVEEVKRAVAVRSGAPDLARRVDAAVDAVVGTPAYQAAYDRWMSARRTWWTGERVAWLMGGVSVLILLLMAAWRHLSVLRLNRRLLETVREREEVRQTLREREVQLQQAQRMEAIGRLAGGVAHDFNNILTVIVSSTKLALEDLPPDEPAREDLEEIATAADRAAALTRQLLAFSRRQVMAPEMLELDHYVEDAGRMIQRLVGEDVRVEVATGAEGVLVEADPSQLHRVLLNLAANARDAMPGGGELRIRTLRTRLDPDDVGGCGAGEYAALEVRDTGTGIEGDVLPHIFEPFFTTRPGGQGTGLGLGTVYGIVRQSGGCVAVDSIPGDGATFTIYLPLADGSQEAPTPPQEPVRQRDRAAGTVLLVEDEAAVRRLAARTLRSRGYDVLEAGSGEQAVRAAARHADGPIRLLVTDVVMPGMDGRTLAEHLAAEHPDLPVLFVSGYPADVQLEQTCRRPDRRFLAKPFSPEELSRAVADLLHRRAEEAG